MNEEINYQIAIPRYQQIALDVASRIVRQEYQVGQKIYARSSIASQYGVSPETARRAICVLSDLNIVTSEKGSGVTIQSLESAINFLQQFNKRQSISSIKENILQSISRQKKEMDQLNHSLSE
ncbi:MAG: TrkA-C domain protein, partial [Evtepia sp.]|nr:TrkA-C domain protein [Evtepia sp.]